MRQVEQSFLGNVALLVLVVLLSSCATTRNFSSTDALAVRQGEGTVTLMPPNVRLNILTAGGVLEPQAEWTEEAQQHVSQAVSDFLEQHNLDVVTFLPPNTNDPDFDRVNELLNLNSAVGRAIQQHKLVTPLPSKADVFDWTLGRDVALIKSRTGADYGLFISFTDSYSSAGRVAVQVFAAFLGVAVPGGEQLGFASLVDLQTGDVVWFNFLKSSIGDLREQEPASEAVELLLASIPKPTFRAVSSDLTDI